MQHDVEVLYSDPCLQFTNSVVSLLAVVQTGDSEKLMQTFFILTSNEYLPLHNTAPE